MDNENRARPPGIGKLKDPGSLRSWLYAITHGIAVDRIRRNTSRERAEQVELESFQEAEAPSFADEDAAAIHRALSQIHVRHREVLVLHFLEDLSIAEIAESCCLPGRNGGPVGTAPPGTFLGEGGVYGVLRDCRHYGGLMAFGANTNCAYAPVFLAVGRLCVFSSCNSRPVLPDRSKQGGQPPPLDF